MLVLFLALSDVLLSSKSSSSEKETSQEEVSSALVFLDSRTTSSRLTSRIVYSLPITSVISKLMERLNQSTLKNDAELHESLPDSENLDRLKRYFKSRGFTIPPNLLIVDPVYAISATFTDDSLKIECPRVRQASVPTLAGDDSSLIPKNPDETIIPITLFAHLYGKTEEERFVMKAALTMIEKIIEKYDLDGSFRFMYKSISEPMKRLQKFDRVLLFLFECTDIMMNRYFDLLNAGSDTLRPEMTDIISDIDDLSTKIEKLYSYENRIPAVWHQYLMFWTGEYSWKRLLPDLAKSQTITPEFHESAYTKFNGKRMNRYNYNTAMIYFRRFNLAKVPVPEYLVNFLRNDQAATYQSYYSKRIPLFSDTRIVAEIKTMEGFPLENLINSYPTMSKAEKEQVQNKLNQIKKNLEIWQSISIFFDKERETTKIEKTEQTDKIEHTEKTAIEDLRKQIYACIVWIIRNR
jgi:hypothetical protein